MERDKLSYLLPTRSVIFILIFLIGSKLTGRNCLILVTGGQLLQL